MSKDMKLIMERWDKFKLQEKVELNTVGQFKKFLKAHRASAAGKEVAKGTIDTILTAMPGVGSVYNILKGTKTAVDALNKIYGADDDIKSNTGLDALNVDDNISKIVDDPVEVKFLNYYANLIDEMGDDEPLPDASEELQDFLATNFEDNTVKK
tara:strand:- start:687 stop:1148 length:462 start_codon:yes stop_codon:yes gene_type:complete